MNDLILALLLSQVPLAFLVVSAQKSYQSSLLRTDSDESENNNNNNNNNIKGM
jgi:hypothetical protein